MDGDALRGTAEDNDNVLNDEYVSSHHARVTVYKDPLAIVIEDLGSTNGTWINGVRTYSKWELQAGD